MCICIYVYIHNFSSILGERYVTKLHRLNVNNNLTQSNLQKCVFFGDKKAMILTDKQGVFLHRTIQVFHLFQTSVL
jgi:hypothetical protein